MANIQDIVGAMKVNPSGIRFTDACKVCDYYFGMARQKSTSHRIYKMPWPGDPRVNIQNDKGKAKEYQINQILKAIKRLEDDKNAQRAK